MEYIVLQEIGPGQYYDAIIEINQEGCCEIVEINFEIIEFL